MQKQQGGVVSRKGLYILHAGEPVIPPKSKKKDLIINLDIDMTDFDWDKFSKEIGEIINGK